jgi:hypothetical protein
VDSSLVINLITNAGVAGIVVVLLVLGIFTPKWVVNDLKAEIAELKATVKAERDRADVAVTSAQTTKDVIAALQSVRHD